MGDSRATRRTRKGQRDADGPACVHPPFVALGLLPGPCQPLGGFTRRRPIRISLPLPRPPGCSAVSHNLLVLVFLSGGFLQKGERPGRLQSLAVARPGPLYPRYLAMTAPFRLTPPPPCRLDTIPVGRNCGA